MQGRVLSRMLKQWCLLLLAAIAAQALVPVSAPEARTTGSPLNPSTIEVSTGHCRRDAAEVQAPLRRDDDGTGIGLAATVLLPSPDSPIALAQRTWPPSRGPPPCRDRRHASARPRAPPAT